ncbi:MAG: flavin-containing monooxygenase [Mycobacteriaceae bacterium]
MNAHLPQHVDLLIVGSGFAGMSIAAKTLAADPHADILVIESESEVGGTWRDNTYPGCACDVPTSLYSFSFAPSSEWTHTFARQPEIFSYLRDVATKTGIREKTLTNCALENARWNAEKQYWEVKTAKGELTATALVAATGALSTPKLPDVPGIESFQGRMFHSARWDHNCQLQGKKIAVVGTGASAIQFVPEIVDQAEHLTVFQRTPGWVLPRIDRELSNFERSVYRRFPFILKAVRGFTYGTREGYVIALAHQTWLLPAFTLIAKAHLRRQVKDPELRKKLTPNFKLGCKRLLLTNGWLSALVRKNVEVVASGVSALTPKGVVDSEGVEREVDVVIFGTGFAPTEPPVAHLLQGKDGRTLAEHWDGSPHAYRGTTIHGFPNLFLMYGPNTNLAHSSIVYMLESQAAYIASAMQVMHSRGIEVIEVKEEAQISYNKDIEQRLKNTVWNSGGCSSWYFDRNGKNTLMWPTFTSVFRNQTKKLDIENYRIESRVKDNSRQLRAKQAL